MVGYRGPQHRRVAWQFQRIAGDHGETLIWRQYVSAETGGSARLAGGGTTRYYQERTITGLLAAPQFGESRFREQQLPAGQVVQGEAVLSLPYPIGKQDELIWRGVTYRVEGDNVSVNYGSETWYRTILKRGIATG